MVIGPICPQTVAATGVGGRAYPGADTYPSTTISGSPFSYDSGNGNLLVEIFGLGQSNICNGCGNS